MSTTRPRRTRGAQKCLAPGCRVKVKGRVWCPAHRAELMAYWKLYRDLHDDSPRPHTPRVCRTR